MEIKTILTQNPKTKPKTEELVFGKFFTDHMVVVDYEEGKGWHNATVQPYAPLEMDPASMVLHYGQAVFEGMKAYRGEKGETLLFRPLKNFERLNKSDDRICIPAIDENFALQCLVELLKVDKDWIPTDEGTSLYIRPFVIATEVALGVHPSSHYKFIIIMSPVGAYYKEGINPVKICIEDEYVRAVKGGIGFTKATANYAISLKGQEKAKSMGYTQVLWLDGVERKYIEEVGTMNVFFKIKGELVTPSLEGSILPGITRDSVIEMARSWGVPVVEKRISIDELYAAFEDGTLEEAFGSGTAAVISPIGEFYWAGKTMKVADGKTGPLSKKLYDTLVGIQTGKLEDTFHWVMEVK